MAEQLATVQEKLKQLQNDIPSEEEFTDITPDEQLTQQIAQQMLAIRYLTVGIICYSSIITLEYYL